MPEQQQTQQQVQKEPEKKIVVVEPTGPYYEGCAILSEEMRRRIDAGEITGGVTQTNKNGRRIQ
jgi:hypothetical protein